MKRVDISKLQRNRGIHLKIGFLLSITFVLFAFNWTTYEKVRPGYDVKPIDEDVVDIVRTKFPEKRQLPPPVVKPSSDPELPKTPEFTPELPPDLDNQAKNAKAPVAPKAPVVEWEKPTPPVIPDLPQKPEIEAPLLIVETMPRFPGCEDMEGSNLEKQNCANEELLRYVAKKFRIPAMARENDISGTVVVQFIVEKDGSITNAKVMRDIGAGCGAEAIRVVEGMPKWRPGIQQGRNVRVQFNLPIKIRLE